MKQAICILSAAAAGVGVQESPGWAVVLLVLSLAASATFSRRARQAHETETATLRAELFRASVDLNTETLARKEAALRTREALGKRNDDHVAAPKLIRSVISELEDCRAMLRTVAVPAAASEDRTMDLIRSELGDWATACRMARDGATGPAGWQYWGVRLEAAEKAAEALGVQS